MSRRLKRHTFRILAIHGQDPQRLAVRLRIALPNVNSRTLPGTSTDVNSMLHCSPPAPQSRMPPAFGFVRRDRRLVSAGDLVSRSRSGGDHLRSPVQRRARRGQEQVQLPPGPRNLSSRKIQPSALYRPPSLNCGISSTPSGHAHAWTHRAASQQASHQAYLVVPFAVAPSLYLGECGLPCGTWR
jgi:hypothetical protein